MTVKQLREQLASLPDTMVILRPHGDHEYVETTFDSGTAIHFDGGYSEDHGPDYMDPGDKVVPALIVQ